MILKVVGVFLKYLKNLRVLLKFFVKYKYIFNQSNWERVDFRLAMAVQALTWISPSRMLS